MPEQNSRSRGSPSNAECVVYSILGALVLWGIFWLFAHNAPQPEDVTPKQSSDSSPSSTRATQDDGNVVVIQTVAYTYAARPKPICPNYQANPFAVSAKVPRGC